MEKTCRKESRLSSDIRTNLAKLKIDDFISRLAAKTNGLYDDHVIKSGDQKFTGGSK